MFLENKYTKWYYTIISAAKARQNIDTYTENHHIIPKSLGGDNSKDNLVALTLREHFICHRLLTKMTRSRDKQKMAFAIHRMKNTMKYGKITSRTYEYIRRSCSESMIEWWNDNPEQRLAASQRLQARWNDVEFRESVKERIDNYWKQPTNKRKRSQQSIEYWKNMSEAEYIAACAVRKEASNRPDVIAAKTQFGEANGMYGKTHTDEVKSKLSKNAIERFKGKSYEDLYGKNKSDQLRKKRSEDMKRIRSTQDMTGDNNPNAKKVIIKGIPFNTSSDAAIHFNRSRPTISEWLRKYDDCYFV